MKQLDATERALTELFARQTENLSIRHRTLPDDTARVRAAQPPRRRPVMIGVAVAVVVVVGAVAISGLRRTADQVDPARRSDPVTRVGAPFHAHTDRADLAVDDYLVAAAGRRFTGNGVAPSAGKPDVDFPAVWALALGWTEGEVGEHLSFSFTSDGRDWWATEIRVTRPGTYYTKPLLPASEDVTFNGTYFRSPLGEPFNGDLDLADPATGTTLHLGGVRLTTSPLRLDCNGLPRPYAVRDVFNDQTIPLPVGTMGGDELQLLDTRDCVLALQNDRATFTYVSQDPSVAEFLPGDCTQMTRAKCERGALLYMQGLRPGETVIAVTVRDGESGDLITTSNLTVIVGSSPTRFG